MLHSGDEQGVLVPLRPDRELFWIILQKQTSALALSSGLQKLSQNLPGAAVVIYFYHYIDKIGRRISRASFGDLRDKD
jgi:hypothetical protein